MAQHKAPTQVTVVTEEKSAFARHIESKWPAYAVAAVILSAIVLGLQMQKNAAEAGRKAMWDDLLEATVYTPRNQFSSLVGLVPQSTDELEDALPKVEGTPAEDAARIVLGTQLATEREYDRASAAFAGLDADFTPWKVNEYPLGPDGSELTLAEVASERLEGWKAWEAQNPGLLDNPALPDGSPRVKMVTSAGDITLGLYEEAAPEHVANFLKLAGEGFYEGTLFHRVIRGFMIQAGDPNTKDADKVDEWGQGGPGYTVPREENDLKHFEGYLSAAKKGNEVESSGSQFFITTGGAHHLDGRHVVYGVVIEGLEAVTAIEAGEIEEGDRPLEPVKIERIEIL